MTAYSTPPASQETPITHPSCPPSLLLPSTSSRPHYLPLPPKHPTNVHPPITPITPPPRPIPAPLLTAAARARRNGTAPLAPAAVPALALGFFIALSDLRVPCHGVLGLGVHSHWGCGGALGE